MSVTNGVRLPVGMAAVFPAGCHLVPGSITEAQDWDEATRVRTPAIDKVTGKRVYHVRVVDMDPTLEGRSREVVVKIAADRTITPYVDTGRCQGRGRCNARMAFSLRATGLKAARPVQAAKDVA